MNIQINGGRSGKNLDEVIFDRIQITVIILRPNLALPLKEYQQLNGPMVNNLVWLRETLLLCKKSFPAGTCLFGSVGRVNLVFDEYHR